MIDPAFSSTTSNIYVAKDFALQQTLLSITIPKGFNCIFMPSFSGFPNEMEVILPPQTTYFVDKEDGKVIIDSTICSEEIHDKAIRFQNAFDLNIVLSNKQVPNAKKRRRSTDLDDNERLNKLAKHSVLTLAKDELITAKIYMETEYLQGVVENIFKNINLFGIEAKDIPAINEKLLLNVHITLGAVFKQLVSKHLGIPVDIVSYRVYDMVRVRYTFLSGLIVPTENEIIQGLKQMLTQTIGAINTHINNIT